MHKFFALILVLSLGLNSYLLFELKALNSLLEEAKSQRLLDNGGELDITQDESGAFNENISSDNQEKDNTNNNAENKALQQQIVQANEAPENMSGDELFNLLQDLQKQQNYNDLVLPLRAYLKLYPSDYRAWLIEADLILHTEPLSTAIAFYYELLDKNLPEGEEEKVKSIIQVNTSKVIQQLSGDTAWDLLATFIEPLLQIDPLNSRYIIGLAKAYGKQGQVNLMENALAALPYDDSRAQKLRSSIYNPKTQDEQTLADEPEARMETASVSKRKIPVFGNGQQFFVQAKIDRYRRTFLIDTGASTTAISHALFIKLPTRDKEFVGRFNVQTAGGSIEAPLYRLSAVTIGEIKMNNVSVIVLPEESFRSNFKGLLGMNVLRNFDFRFDPENQKMSLFER
ncbi:TIGR02281 family clan AA aspartic protease [Glaciecola sp. MF2-115]|uniref:retropepsin-like aspartic protease family protein n=1 Tax=Glaciecola sp. MF2-115 TaxID=3384827 RepID=UPI0039A2FD40